MNEEGDESIAHKDGNEAQNEWPWGTVEARRRRMELKEVERAPSGIVAGMALVDSVLPESGAKTEDFSGNPFASAHQRKRKLFAGWR